MIDYLAFLETKGFRIPPAGIEVPRDALTPALFPFQRDLVAWSLRKGRAAIWADTGLGKTICQLTWARHAAPRTLILAPLAVAEQTVREGLRFGIPVTYARSQAAAAPAGITITNYEMMGHFDPEAFGAVVLDESSILKCFNGKTRTALIEAFRETPMKLACTATPAPNDISEIANHCEFLSVMPRVEMLAAFFIHDDEGWRLKGHARTSFYRWMASWGMTVRKPSDLGYDDGGYDLCGLTIEPHFIEVETPPSDRLFAVDLKGVTDRAVVRRDTLKERVETAAALIRSSGDEPWIAWVGLNDEGRRLHEELPGSILVEGSQSIETKVAAMDAFSTGRARVIIVKPSIAGHGMNWQHCARMVFVGLSDSYESYYQCIRRCYRYGQRRPVTAHIVLSDREQAIYANVLRKEQEARAMAEALIDNVSAFEREELRAPRPRQNYQATAPVALPAWLGGSR